MNDRSKRDIAIVLFVFLLSISTIIVGLLICFGILSTPEVDHQESNVLEFWESKPLAYGSLFPPSNNSWTDGVLPHSFTYDVIIVGAGMAGLSAALTLCKRDKKVLVLEANVRRVFSRRYVVDTIAMYCYDISIFVD